MSDCRPAARNSRALALTLAVVTLVAARSAAAEQPPLSDWSRVERIKPGRVVLVRARGAGPVSCRAVGADGSMLVVLRVNTGRVPRPVEDALALVGPDWAALVAGRRIVTIGSVEMSRGGVFDGGRKIGEFIT